MLKITVEDHLESVSLKLEGKLAGPWVQETERAWKACVNATAGKPVRVDLCEVTFIDCGGKKLLQQMHTQGARLCASGFLMKNIVAGVLTGTDYAK